MSGPVAGQSNLEWPLAKTVGAAEAIVAANLPWMRHLKVPHRVAEAPARDLDTRWVVCSPAKAGEFSAVAFHFVRQLYRDASVPVGLLNASRGGSVIEAWLGPPAIRARLSRDHGQSWSPELKLTADAPNWDLGYPSTAQLSDGSLVTVWYEAPADNHRAVLRQAKWRLAGECRHLSAAHLSGVRDGR